MNSTNSSESASDGASKASPSSWPGNSTSIMSGDDSSAAPPTGAREVEPFARGRGAVADGGANLGGGAPDLEGLEALAAEEAATARAALSWMSRPTTWKACGPLALRKNHAASAGSLVIATSSPAWRTPVVSSEQMTNEWVARSHSSWQRPKDWPG
eukprot:scaffold15267_cov118-Isochrysis_galbana.AAC.12